MYDLFLKNGEVFVNGKLQKLNIGVSGNKITYIGDEIFNAKEVLDFKGKWVLPGFIDSQVHFREPGLTHKEDLNTGTKGALLGGVTAILEMPNTNPSTSTVEALNEKLKLAKDRCYVDYGFFVGATHENVKNLTQLEKIDGCCGIKIFMGSSTGSLLLADDKDLEQVFATAKGPIAVHCEDEARLIVRKPIAENSKNVLSHPDWRDEESSFIATEKVVRLSKKYNKSVHILHISSKKEIEFLEKNKDRNITVECTPQHLTLYAPDCYEVLGTRAQMNPPIREKNHRDALIVGLKKGVVDVIGSDHAPHTIEEKAKPYPNSPSGMPGVQTIVSLMLDKVNQGIISLSRCVDLLCYTPLRIYKVLGRGPIQIGNEATFTVVDMEKENLIKDSDMATRSGWTPFDGQKFRGTPVATILSGRVAMLNGQIIGAPQGQPLKFQRV